MTLSVRRGDQNLSLTMKVIERNDDPQRFADMVDPEKNIIPQLGVLVIEVDEKVQAMLPGLRHTYGLVIAAESSDAPYSGESLRVGDVILPGESGAGGYHSCGDGNARCAEIRRSSGNSGGARRKPDVHELLENWLGAQNWNNTRSYRTRNSNSLQTRC